MKHWKPIAAGCGIAALALLCFALTGRQDSSVSANDRGSASEQKSFLSRLYAPLRPETAVLPVGTRIPIRLEDAISTERNSSGERFAASLDGPLMLDGKILAPARSKVLGQLTNVTRSGRVKGRARLTMVLRKLVVGNKEYELNTAPLTLVAPGTKKRDVAIIAGGAAAGAAIGAIAGAGKGAAIGAGIGGGSGTGYVLATRGKPVAYGPESRFTLALSEPLQLPVHRKSAN